MQTTIANKVEFNGKGLHSGMPAAVRVTPAGPDHGISFTRVDVKQANNVIPARHEFVSDTTLSTKIENSDGASVGTIEHLMAGLAACGIHNASIEIDGCEVPILDGSAVGFVERILHAGVASLGVPVRVLRVLKPVSVSIGSARARLEPFEGFEMSFSVSFPQPVGNQSRSAVLSNGNIVRDLVDSRTFCSSEDIGEIHSMGYGLGGTSDNVLLYSSTRLSYLSEPRRKDECVRHKMLDAVGDLALAGAPILGRFVGERSGHATTCALLKKLFRSRDSFETIPADERMAAALPGVGAKLSDIPTIH